MKDQIDYLKFRDILITLPNTELLMDCYQSISTKELLGIPDDQNKWRLVPYNHYIPPYSVAVFWTINGDKQGTICEIKHLESAEFIPEPISFAEEFQAVFVLESVWQRVSFFPLPADADGGPIWVSRKHGPDVLIVPCDGGDWVLVPTKDDCYYTVGYTEILTYHQMADFLIEEATEWVTLEFGTMHRKPYRDNDERDDI